MQRSRWPLVLAGLTFAAALLAGLYGYRSLVQAVPVVTAVRDLPVGTELSLDLLRVEQIPAGGRPPEALYGPGQAVGRFTAMPLLAGHPITERQLEPQSAASPLSPGREQRLVAVPILRAALPYEQVRTGDRVELIAAWPARDGRAARVVTLAGGARIADLRPGGAEEPMATVTLLLSRAEAAETALALASEAGLYIWVLGRDGQ